MTTVHVESWGYSKQALVVTSSTGCSLECGKVDGRENLRYHELPKTELPKTSLWGHRIENSQHWPKQVGNDIIWSVWGKNWKMSRCVHAKSLQLQLHSTLCNPMDCSPQAPVFWILQARILELVAMPFFRRSTRPRDQTCVSSGSCPAGRFFTIEPPGKSK